MIKTSPSYNPFPTLRDVDFRIKFAVIDSRAADASAQINTKSIMGDIKKTTDSVNAPAGRFADLEKNVWRLDGSFTFPKSPEENVGFWSEEISDENGIFNPVISAKYTFSAPISTLGWTLHFDPKAKQFCKKIKVTAFDAGGQAVYSAVHPNAEPVAAIQHYVGDYYAVQFEFLETSEPLRRLRLSEVDFGLTKSYDRNSLGVVSIKYAADPVSAKLPTRELKFTFDNSDKQYNLLNPDGVYQYLQDGQKIDVSAVIGGEAVDMGHFTFTKADVSKSAIVPEITANDPIYAMSEATFENPDGTEKTLKEAVELIIGADAIPMLYDSDIASRKVVLGMKKGENVRECIRMLAQAARCTALIERNGTLHFTEMKMKSAEDSRITADELYNYSGVKIVDKTEGIRLNVTNEYNLDAEGNSARYTYVSGTEKAAKSISNDCVAPASGQAVADWLLDGFSKRKYYSVQNRCDPAVEIGDTVRIDDIFQNRENALVTEISLKYDGTLSAKTGGVGV